MRGTSRIRTRRARSVVPALLAGLFATVLTGAGGLAASPAGATTCPAYRASVRAGTDAAVARVQPGTDALTTVAALGALPRPASATADLRIAPTETARYRVSARLVGYRVEPDGDLALSLRAADGTVMLADVPDPACVGAASPWRAAVVAVRAEVRSLVDALPPGGRPDVDVQAGGVGFFDRTGRAGAAANSVALHPVLSLSVGAAPVGVDRTGGSDRFATAAAVSAQTFSPGGDVFVATGTAFPDAVAASAAASALGAPVLLVTATSVPAPTAAELARLQARRIYLVGSAGAASSAVAAALGRFGPVERISGGDRFATAAAVSARFATPGAPDAFVATGYDFPDALAGAPAAGALGVPLLLVGPTGVPVATAAELTRLRPARITVLGSTGAVPAAVATALAGYAPSVRRLSGGDRYATSAAISAAVFGSAARARMATGTGFADALAGGPAAAQVPGPVLLSRPTCVPSSVAGELTRLGVGRVSLLGSVSALSPAVAVLQPCAVYLPPSPYLSAVPVPAGCLTAGPAIVGVKVYLVQKALGLVGHKERYDSATVSAVKAFQSRTHLPVTGLVDRTTWNALRTGYDFCLDRFTAQPTVVPTAPAAGHVAAMVKLTKAQLGRPYIWGGAGPMGYDCSGLVLQGMYAGGRVLPGVDTDLHVKADFSTARALYASRLTHVPFAQRKAGDLVFWGSPVHHVAVYLGNGQIVEAVRPKIRTASVWTHGTPLGTVVRPFP